MFCFCASFILAELLRGLGSISSGQFVRGKVQAGQIHNPHTVYTVYDIFDVELRIFLSI